MLKPLFAILLLVCCSFYVPQDSSPSIEKLVMKAAETQMPLYLSKIPPGHDSDYGFGENEQIENCEVDRPYRLLTFSDDFYSAPGIDSEMNYLDIKNEWLVPVRLSGQDRVLLAVKGTPTNLVVTEMSNPDLAKELQEKKMITNKDDDYYLLRVARLNADFLVAEHDNSFGNSEFIPLRSATSAIPSLAKNKKKSYNLEEAQSIVKAALNSLGQKAPVKKVTPAKHKSRKIKLQTSE